LGITVVLVTQPYRLDGNPRYANEQSLDQAWEAVWPIASVGNVPVVAGGRSAGSQVACRTAQRVGADAVLVLAYPLLGPGSADELLATGKPALVVQGGSDPFGRPEQFPKLRPDMKLVAIPGANHMFARESSGLGPDPLLQVTDAVTMWLEQRLRG
jgi:predicted alpha/beta-hydrolase family hydrolase